MKQAVTLVLCSAALLGLMLVGSAISRFLFSGNPKVSYTPHVNLGSLQTQENYHVFLQLENRGRRSVQLTPVTSCKCLPVSVDKEVLEPKGIANVGFSLTTGTELGPVTKSVKVLVKNGSASREVTFIVEGNVDKGVTTHNGSVDFGYLGWGKTVTREVKIEGAGPSGVLSVTCPSPDVRHTLEVREDGIATVGLTVSHPGKQGSVDTRIFVVSQSQILGIPVTAKYASIMQFSSPCMLLARSSEATTATFNIATSESGKVEWLRDENVPEGLGVGIAPSGDGYAHTVTVTVEPNPEWSKAELSFAFSNAGGDTDVRPYPLYVSRDTANRESGNSGTAPKPPSPV